MSSTHAPAMDVRAAMGLKKTPGQVACEAFQSEYSKQFPNVDAFFWDDLLEEEKHCWHAAATALASTDGDGK